MGTHLKNSLQREAIIPPNFWETLKKDNCKERLQGLYLQKIYRKDLDEELKEEPEKISPVQVIHQPPWEDFRYISISHHIIFDLSATLYWGDVAAQCFEIDLDSFNTFHLKFMKEGRFFDEVSFTPPIDSLVVRENHGLDWNWKTYKACLHKPLETDNLTIHLSCDILVERFCYIDSIRFL